MCAARGRAVARFARLTADPAPPLPHPHHHPRAAQAREQLSRERVIAGAELKLLHEELKFCYHKAGVNHYVDCKPLVEAIAAKSRTRTPYWGMPGAPSREW